MSTARVYWSRELDQSQVRTDFVTLSMILTNRGFKFSLVLNYLNDCSFVAVSAVVFILFSIGLVEG